VKVEREKEEEEEEKEEEEENAGARRKLAAQKKQIGRLVGSRRPYKWHPRSYHMALVVTTRKTWCDQS
jgi:hypothetical protein